MAATGFTYAEAYSQVYGCSRKTAHESSSRLSKNIKFTSRVDEIRAIVGQKEQENAKDLISAFDGKLLTMLERRAFLARVVRIDMGSFDINKDGDLVQEMTTTEGPNGTTTKLKLPGKRECILLDAELAGELAKPGTTVNVGVAVQNVMTEDRAKQLQEKKRAALERRRVKQLPG